MRLRRYGTTPPKPSGRLPSLGDAKALRILLVEDNADTRRYTAMALSLRGHRVVGAACLQTARDAAAGPLDLLISDIELSDGTDHELMRELAPRGILGVALSGFGSEDDIRMSRAAGFSAHLTKPFEIGRLDSAVRAYATCREQPSTS